MSVEAFLKALMRDVAWNFFYGIVNFDPVIGTMNHYGNVDLFAGRYNDAYRKAELDHQENFDADQIMATFQAMLADWTNDGFDPFAAPQETGSAFGGRGDNLAAVARTRSRPSAWSASRRRAAAQRRDRPPHQPHVRRRGRDEPSEAEAGYEVRSPPSTCTPTCRAATSPGTRRWCRCARTAYCPTTEEFILPIIHGNDRVEWFVQLSDEIHWKVEDRETRRPGPTWSMKAGDVAAMPADIRHQGYSPKRAMLLVSENGSPALPDLIAEGKAPKTAVEF